MKWCREYLNIILLQIPWRNTRRVRPILASMSAYTVHRSVSFNQIMKRERGGFINEICKIRYLLRAEKSLFIFQIAQLECLIRG
jgi:hypothetical protein